jgi:hypothetical protein
MVQWTGSYGGGLWWGPTEGDPQEAVLRRNTLDGLPGRDPLYGFLERIPCRKFLEVFPWK